LHDRACELYQQIAGILNIRKQTGIKGNGADLAEHVYGKEHFDQHHKGLMTFYKEKYLRQKKEDIKLIYGFPNGVPGGWSQTRKLHFIGHS